MNRNEQYKEAKRTFEENNRPMTTFDRSVLILWVLAVLGVLFFSSCAQTTLYRDGQKIAAFQGDMTNLEYAMSEDGSVRWKAATVDHSTPTKAQKEGAANIVTQAGIAVAASGLTTLLP